MSRNIFYKVSKFFPGLKNKLWKAGIYKSPQKFLQETLISSFVLTTFLIVMIFIIFTSFNVVGKTFILIIPFIFIIIFFYMVNIPNALISKRIIMIDKDILSIGRQILVQIKSGVPLFDVITYVGKQDLPIAIHFREISNNVSLGVGLEESITETMKRTPSEKLKRLFGQMLNSLKTGAELSSSISSLLDQVTKEQLIEIKRYGKKLNPIAMFYMMIAVIVPTLGITIIIIISSFMSLNISLFVLFMILGVICFIQFMFVNIIKKTRPMIDL